LRSRKPIGAGTGAGLSAYSVGQQGGAEAVTLSSGEMPSHAHGLFQSTALAIAPGELPVVIPFVVAAGSTDSAGGGGSHENIDPYQAFNFVIVAL
jgi:microcystin-dependent protein